jgi:hypothetical protein
VLDGVEVFSRENVELSHVLSEDLPILLIYA